MKKFTPEIFTNPLNETDMIYNFYVIIVLLYVNVTD